jgi:hypothetical protein
MKLNALLKTLGFLALAATPVVAGTAPAPKNPIAPAPVNDDLGINASLGYDTNYVWRGLNYGQHWVRGAVMAPSSSLAALLKMAQAAPPLSGMPPTALWQVTMTASPPIAELAPFPNKASFQRLEAGAGIAHDFGPATLSLGYRYINNMGLLASQGALNTALAGAQGIYGMNDIHQLSLGQHLARSDRPCFQCQL